MNIPDYTLLQSCGKGAYGQVWLAQSKANKLVALKYIPCSQAFDREYDGIRNYSLLPESPYLIRILHLGKLDDGFFYTMELSDGLYRNGQFVPETLCEKIKREKNLSPGEVMELACAILNALSVIHDAKLVHRDIKPENILYFDGKPKLSDMGLIRHTDDTVSLCGTLGYIPPERLTPDGSALPYEKSDDLYALGKVLYCAMSGNAVEKFPSCPEDMIQNTLCSHLNQIILKACGKREERFQCVTDFRSALQNGLPVQEKARNSSTWRKLQLFVFALSCMLTGLLAAAGVWFCFQKGPFERKAVSPQAVKPQAAKKTPAQKKTVRKKYTHTLLYPQLSQFQADKIRLTVGHYNHENRKERTEHQDLEWNRLKERLKQRSREMMRDPNAVRRIVSFDSERELNLFKLREHADEMKRNKNYEPRLIYEKGEKSYSSPDLGKIPRQKKTVFAYVLAASAEFREKDALFQQKYSGKGKFIAYQQKALQDLQNRTSKIYSGELPKEFSIRCKVLTEFEKNKFYTFELNTGKRASVSKVAVNLSVSRSLINGSVLQVEIIKEGKSYITNFLNYLRSVSDYCFDCIIDKMPEEFFFMEIVKTRESLAVYINDVLMMNVPEKRILRRGKFILQPEMNGSIDFMHIYDIAPNASWPEEIRYRTPDRFSRKQ